MSDPAGESVSLAERLVRLRTGLIARPGFQRWAARFPLTRGLVRRRSRALFDLCAGFVYSQILSACVRLEIFQRLAEGPQSAATIAAGADLSLAATQRLLKAATSLRLLRALPGDRFALDDFGAAVIGTPGLSAMIAHHALLYDDLSDPVALLRTGAGERLSRFWAYAPTGAEAQKAYSELMAASQAFIAEDVLDAFAFAGRTQLMDVGGGEGVFLRAVARRAPHLRLGLFDLPLVADRARSAFTAAGLEARIDAIGGDFLSDPLPRGADVFSLIRVLHDHDDPPAQALLRRIHAALPPGGILLIAEPMSGIPGAEPIGDAYFGFYLLAMGRGRPRTSQEIVHMLRSAGFASVHNLRTPRPAVVTALLAIKA